MVTPFEKNLFSNQFNQIIATHKEEKPKEKYIYLFKENNSDSYISCKKSDAKNLSNYSIVKFDALLKTLEGTNSDISKLKTRLETKYYSGFCGKINALLAKVFSFFSYENSSYAKKIAALEMKLAKQQVKTLEQHPTLPNNQANTPSEDLLKNDSSKITDKIVAAEITNDAIAAKTFESDEIEPDLSQIENPLDSSREQTPENISSFILKNDLLELPKQVLETECNVATSISEKPVLNPTEDLYSQLINCREINEKYLNIWNEIFVKYPQKVTLIINLLKELYREDHESLETLNSLLKVVNNFNITQDDNLDLKEKI